MQNCDEQKHSHFLTLQSFSMKLVMGLSYPTKHWFCKRSYQASQLFWHKSRKQGVIACSIDHKLHSSWEDRSKGREGNFREEGLGTGYKILTAGASETLQYSWSKISRHILNARILMYICSYPRILEVTYSLQSLHISVCRSCLCINQRYSHGRFSLEDVRIMPLFRTKIQFCLQMLGQGFSHSYSKQFALVLLITT